MSFGVVQFDGKSLISFGRLLIFIGVVEVYNRGDHLSSGAFGVKHAYDC